MSGYGQEFSPAGGAPEGRAVLREELEAVPASWSRDDEGPREGG